MTPRPVTIAGVVKVGRVCGTVSGVEKINTALLPPETERVVHHVRQLRGAQFRDGCQTDGGIGLAEAGVGRELLAARASMQTAASIAPLAARVTEESFRAGEGRDVVAEQRLQCFGFGDVVIARASAVGVDVVDVGW